ncbi:MAG: hypothetical protein MJY49_03165 [Bacteroidales bacterium]|nr:hypothetical protein [Bacteroidales bacterium]
MDTELSRRLDRIEALTVLAAKNVLSVKDAALLTGRTEKSIRNRLPEIPHNKGPMGVVIARKDFEEWLLGVSITPESHLMR